MVADWRGLSRESLPLAARLLPATFHSARRHAPVSRRASSQYLLGGDALLDSPLPHRWRRCGQAGALPMKRAIAIGWAGLFPASLRYLRCHAGLMRYADMARLAKSEGLGRPQCLSARRRARTISPMAVIMPPHGRRCQGLISARPAATTADIPARRVDYHSFSKTTASLASSPRRSRNLPLSQ